MKDVQGVVFDLDGTLVTCQLCFQKMRQEIGCPLDEDILKFVESLSPNEKLVANQHIEQMELEDAHNATWITGAKKFITLLSSLNMPTAIITRNSREASDIKKRTNRIPIDTVVTREDAPAKPDPTALLALSEQWQILPKNMLYVGDYLHDINVAKNAGVKSALFCESDIPSYAKEADLVFHHYDELIRLFNTANT